MKSTVFQRLLGGLLIFSGVVCLLGFWQYHREPYGLEYRFLLFAQNMWRDGFQPFPMAYHHYYVDYLATQTWFVVALAKSIGTLTPFVAMLPTIIASGLTASILFISLAKRSQAWGVAAVLMLLATYQWTLSSSGIALDPFVALSAVFCFWIVGGNHSLFWALLGCIFGFLCRGPIGFIIPAAVVFAVLFSDFSLKQCLKWGLIALIGFALCVAAWLGLASHAGGPALMHKAINMQFTYRLHSHSQPVWFYLQVLLSNYAVTGLIALVTIISVFPTLFFRSENMHVLRQLVFWVLIILLGMSIPGAKRARYILAISPALAAIASYPFTMPSENKVLLWSNKWFTWLFAVLPVIALLALLMFSYKLKGVDLEPALIGLSLMGLLVLFSFFLVPSHYTKVTMRLFAGALSMMILVLALIQPILVMHDNASVFTKHLEKYLTPKTPLVLYKMNPDQEAIKLMAMLDKPIKPYFVDDLSKINKTNPNNLYVSRKANIDALPKKLKGKFELLYRGQLGHKDCLLLRVKHP